MNKTSRKSTGTKSNRRAYLAAILVGSILVSQGCGIPGLRCAQPGAAVPQSYNWNNGAAFSQPATEADSAPPVAPIAADATDSAAVDATLLPGNANEIKLVTNVVEVEQDTARLTAQDDSQSFTSFIKAAESIPLESSDTGLDAMDAEVDFGITRLESSAHLPQTAFYSDPFLTALIQQALTGNQELKILAEEIRIANNETYARSGEYRPFVTLGAGAGIEKPGRHTRAGAVEDQLQVAPGTEFPEPLPDFLAAANVSWELDIWRKLRNAQGAAAMRYLGTREGRNYIVTRLVAEVAEDYYQLLALDNRLLTLDKTIEIQQQSLQFANAMKQGGRGTELPVQRFQAEVRKNQSEKSIIAQNIVELENRINFLLGRYPQPIERISVEFVDLNLNTLSAGVPSQLLQNRADIRQAEREVTAAGLDIKVARARFYPSLSLSAGLGWNAFATGYLFRTPESLIYGLAGELVGPLINKRAIKADYCSANAAQLQAIYNYQQTVLQAHIEVVNQITKVENYRQSIEVKKQQLEALESSVDVANKLFQSGRAEYVEVLLAQRELMEAKMLLIEIKQEQLSAIVNAYQALGGGGF